MEEFDIECPECGAELTVTEDLIGQQIPCPACENELDLRFDDDDDEDVDEVQEEEEEYRPRRRFKRRKSRFRRTPPGAPSHRTFDEPYDGPAAMSTTAVIGIVCVFFGFLALPAAFGIILGFNALSQIRASNGRLKGSILAHIGIGLNSAWMLAIAFGILVLAIKVKQQKEARGDCIANLNTFGKACESYAAGNKPRRFPAVVDELLAKGHLSDASLPTCRVGLEKMKQAPEDMQYDNTTGYRYVGARMQFLSKGSSRTIIAGCDHHAVDEVHVMLGDGTVKKAKGTCLEDACDRYQWIFPGKNDNLPKGQRKLIHYNCEMRLLDELWEWQDSSRFSKDAAWLFAKHGKSGHSIFLVAQEPQTAEALTLTEARKAFGHEFKYEFPDAVLVDDKATRFKDRQAHASVYDIKSQNLKTSLLVFTRGEFVYSLLYMRHIRDPISDADILDVFSRTFRFNDWAQK